MQAGRIRVGILEDEQLFRESLEAILQGAGMDVVVRARDVEEFLSQMREVELEVALVDLRLERSGSEEVGDGLRVVEALRELRPHTRVLVLTAQRQELRLLERCFRAGASGYLYKLQVGCTELVSAIEKVVRGEWLVPQELLSPAPPTPPGAERSSVLERLTSREREVLRLVAAGEDNLKIAAQLNITERTVKAHVSNLYRKLEVQNRVEMARRAYQFGLVRPEDMQSA